MPTRAEEAFHPDVLAGSARLITDDELSVARHRLTEHNFDFDFDEVSAPQLRC